jgi:hypothetical protein
MDLSERWLPIPGYEGLYEVSDRGQVRSLDRYVECGHFMRFHAGRVLVHHVRRDGYHSVSLSRNGIAVRRLVHEIVLTTFSGPRPDGLVSCHNDGNKDDNSTANLRWDTPSENSFDVVRHGRNAFAIRTHCLNGHELPEHVLGKARKCSQCDLDRGREKYQRYRDSRPKRQPKPWCVNGHSMTDENTRYTRTGKPVCRTCERAAGQRYRDKKRTRAIA